MTTQQFEGIIVILLTATRWPCMTHGMYGSCAFLYCISRVCDILNVSYWHYNTQHYELIVIPAKNRDYLFSPKIPEILQMKLDK